MSTQQPHRDPSSQPAEPPVAPPPNAHPPAPPPPPRPAAPIAAWMPPQAPPARAKAPAPKPASQSHPSKAASRAAASPVGRAARTQSQAPSGTSAAVEQELIAPQLPLKERLLRQAPPWLVSAIIHMVVLIILALITLPGIQRRVLELTASYSEFDGKQLEVFELSGVDDADELETEMAIGDTPADDPLAAPPMINFDPTAFAMTSDLEVPTIGTLLTGREAGNKEALLLAYGGTPGTEASVQAALEWLKRYQQRDGTWRLDGPYADGGIDENRAAATAMAMLAFQGAGHTHLSEGPYRNVLQKGMNALLKMEDDDGNFFHSGPIHHRLYSQAMATIAVCELYGMTKDEKLREPAQRAINYAIAVQTPEGGWRYEPKVDSDTSVTGWFAMALQSGRMAGLDVPSYGLDGIGRYLDSAQVDSYGSQYSYQPGGGPRLSMTAEALLCRQYLGWQRDDLRLQGGVEQILENPITWESGRANVYYWYYATQVLHHVGGKPWFEWNKAMREQLPAQQVQSNRERGSWDPTGDAHDVQGGRLYVTCLCTYMLEVYYRHLPIYHSAGAR